VARKVTAEHSNKKGKWPSACRGRTLCQRQVCALRRDSTMTLMRDATGERVRTELHPEQLDHAPVSMTRDHAP